MKCGGQTLVGRKVSRILVSRIPAQNPKLGARCFGKHLVTLDSVRIPISSFYSLYKNIVLDDVCRGLAIYPGAAHQRRACNKLKYSVVSYVWNVVKRYTNLYFRLERATFVTLYDLSVKCGADKQPSTKAAKIEANKAYFGCMKKALSGAIRRTIAARAKPRCPVNNRPHPLLLDTKCFSSMRPFISPHRAMKAAIAKVNSIVLRGRRGRILIDEQSSTMELKRDANGPFYEVSIIPEYSNKRVPGGGVRVKVHANSGRILGTAFYTVRCRRNGTGAIPSR